ncbi:MAG: hypothetical protein M3P85_01200 [Actinomycetota bacterium]|jgi:hypothetical protein|nr:hypothetical protein [Actinomycetota bacterium]PLS75439.1 MAG: hypothetical protein CYG61_07450 [Actinomycetota bacterium]
MAAADEEATSASQLEAWVREELHLGDDTSVQITEKPGNDPRCSPVVTEVLIADPGQDPYAFHIERPLRELEPMDVIAALAFGGGH